MKRGSPHTTHFLILVLPKHLLESFCFFTANPKEQASGEQEPDPPPLVMASTCVTSDPVRGLHVDSDKGFWVGFSLDSPDRRRED